MDNMDFRKERFPSYIIIIVTLVFILFLNISDYLTGSELSFSIFYLIPISFITIYLNYNYGVLASILCCVAWFLADYFAGAKYSTILIPYWNAFVRLIYFCLHSIILGNLIKRMNQTKHIGDTDTLTNIPNYRCFYDFALKEIERAKRFKKPITLSYIDLDNFKKVNDKFGHSTGDYLLKTVAGILNNNIRPNDITARIGGDEFVILLSEINYKKSLTILKRIQKRLLFSMKENNWPVTFSIGAITFNNISVSVEHMISETDKLMYLVKNSGKNNLKHLQK